MKNLNPEQNRLYEKASDLHPSHWKGLVDRGPDEAARASGAEWDGSTFLLPLLGRSLRVDPAARSVRFEDDPGHEPGYQRALVAVSYLVGALDAPSRGEWVSLRELPGGDSFFRGPHSLATARLEKAFGRRPADLPVAAAALGGWEIPAGDAAADVPALPKVPLRAVLWAETEEFPAAASLLTDARAYLHLPLDVLWALTNVAIADLLRAAP